MAQEYLNTRIILRNDSSANWLDNEDQILLKGEVGIEFLTDGKAKMKIGDGTTPWSTLPYFGGDDRNTHIFETIVQSGETKDIAINRVVGDTELASGDIAVVKELIAEGADGQSKYAYTAYVYDVSIPGWVAMDGNYNAENVYFNEDITFTANIGAVELEDGKSSGTFSAKGKSLEAVLKAIMALTKDPIITNPSFSLTISKTTDTGNYELGSKIVSFGWNGTYTDGTYEYGFLNEDGTVNTATAANCAKTYAVSCDQVGTKTGDTEDGTWTLTTPITIDSTSAKTYGTITNVCTYSDSNRTPVNNIGEAVDGKIVGSSITKNGAISITGYREGFFYGSLTSAKAASELTSDDIRGLSKSGAKYAKGKKSYNVPVGAAMVIFACPSSNTGVTDILNTTVNAGMNDAFGLGAPTKISVEGANDYTAVEYNVWSFTPAEPYGSTASLSITLG